MKIEDLLTLREIISRSQSKPRTQEAENFAAHLQEAQKEDAPPALNQPSGIRPPRAAIDILPATSIPADCLRAVEEGLGRLEKYQQGLGSANISLKSLAPLAAALEEDSRRLQELAAQLPSDSPLRSIAEELGALSRVESFKFQRGDYL